MSQAIPLLEINDLAVRYPSGSILSRLAGGPREVTILPGTSLHIAPGETLGLIGESGSGKTTLGRAAVGLAPISGGTIRIGEEATSMQGGATWDRMRRDVGLMFQDPVAALDPRMRIGTSVTEPLVIHRMLNGDRRAKAVELLAQVGLGEEFADRFPHEVSGGQARRATVARALALDPSLVIADEPTAGLDLSVQGELLNLLNDLQARLGISFLLITHNLAVARHVTDRIAIMYLGRIVETGPSTEIFARPAHPYTRALLGARRKGGISTPIKGEVPSLTSRPKGCEFHTRCPLVADRCRTEAPSLRSLGGKHIVACHFAEAVMAGAAAQSKKPTTTGPDLEVST
ncbi:ABC transporter ATP-binding protein [Pelagovum pacificum]|uniref:ABC transporter ATP-binding protein n=1 Tax=Pelagovum pacificum TaxID=2588711 RepID=A0A5C5GBN9_9RHOB|nr:ABC transporter ATP-binding protein [Pelagovum pacificum]QQA41732.1 ABC transporter ATP-binding protein [Pelagovum pacificum]TNY31007.1 ABC transporter ATP-binding protein [Pelagovum pacificum]